MRTRSPFTHAPHARRRRLMAGAVTIVVVGCGADASEQRESEQTPVQVAPADSTSAAATLPAPEGEELTRLAATGATLFNDRGCVGCHAIGGELAAAPDLEGVTERRTYDWLMAMMTKPDSMTRNDPVARDLLARHMTQMPDLNLSDDEARALFAYLHTVSED